MLTDERIDDIAESDEITGDARYAFARAIEAEVIAPLQARVAQHEIDFALEHDDKLALQAKVAEQSAEIERLKSERDEYNSAWQHAGEEYRKLRDSLLSLAGAFK